MPIEGLLREFGLQDVFQLLDLSRKTGILTVTSASRDREGALVFDRGAITGASLGERPHALADFLVRGGKVTEHELARARDEQCRRGGCPEIGVILVDLGVLSRDELERHTRLVIEESRSS